MKRIYIAGCGGMLGEAFYRQFSSGYELRCTDIDVNDTWLANCDFRDLDGYLRDVATFRPDYLFHLGAHTDIEYCELHPDETYRTNTLAVENGVFIAPLLGIPQTSPRRVKVEEYAGPRGSRGSDHAAR